MSISYNHQGEKCKRCGEIIEVYSLSGYCRSCWHRNRLPQGRNKSPKRILDTTYQCDGCGRFIEESGFCSCCLARDSEYLNKYRTFRGQQEHRFIYELNCGVILRGWVIHHLNGLKGDNRKENLVATPKGDHDSKAIVSELKKRILTLEKQLKELKDG